ncbi:MAG: tetratricopeptide repeat protein, partial [Magnetococcales bacterium]|nr:tetratricopeptide repeat protein [Magnetococcales bacterium]
FSNRLRLDPDNLALNQGLAECLRSAGRLPEAEILMNSLIKNKKSDPYLLRNRGLVRIEMGKHQEAEQDLRDALALLPDNADIQFHQAFALKELKKPQDASRILRQLIAQNPNEPRYFYLLGIAEGQRKGHEGEGHLAMGRYYALIQQKKNALWHFQEAMRLLPTKAPEREIAQTEWKQAQEIMEPEVRE